jgi:hypothetical protein
MCATRTVESRAGASRPGSGLLRELVLQGQDLAPSWAPLSPIWPSQGTWPWGLGSRPSEGERLPLEASLSRLHLLGPLVGLAGSFILFDSGAHSVHSVCNSKGRAGCRTGWGQCPCSCLIRWAEREHQGPSLETHGPQNVWKTHSAVTRLETWAAPRQRDPESWAGAEAPPWSRGAPRQLPAGACAGKVRKLLLSPGYWTQCQVSTAQFRECHQAWSDGAVKRMSVVLQHCAEGRRRRAAW